MNLDSNTTEEITNNNQLEYLTTAQAANLLGLKLSRIRNMIFKGQIPHLKIGASVRFNKTNLLAWYESKSKGALK